MALGLTPRSSKHLSEKTQSEGAPYYGEYVEFEEDDREEVSLTSATCLNKYNKVKANLTKFSKSSANSALEMQCAKKKGKAKKSEQNSHDIQQKSICVTFDNQKKINELFKPGQTPRKELFKSVTVLDLSDTSLDDTLIADCNQKETVSGNCNVNNWLSASLPGLLFINPDKHRNVEASMQRDYRANSEETIDSNTAGQSVKT